MNDVGILFLHHREISVCRSSPPNDDADFTAKAATAPPEDVKSIMMSHRGEFRCSNDTTVCGWVEDADPGLLILWVDTL